MKKSALIDGKTTDKVKTRILLPFTVVILSVIGAFVLSTYMFQQNEHEKGLQEHVAAAERLFRYGVEKDTAMMQAALIAIGSNEKIKSAYLEGDRQKLIALARPLFDQLRKNNRVTHFYFTGPDQINFLRLHKPDKHGDIINRVTTRQAIVSEQFAGGLELGFFGTLTLRVVMPWFVDDQLIGVLELGEEIGHIIQGVHQVLGSDLLALVDERYIDPKRWEQGKRMLGHQNNWLHIGPAYVVGRAMQHIPEPLIKFLKQDNRPQRAVLHMQEHGHDLYAATIPLATADGQQVGCLVIVHDVTASLAAFHTVIVSTTLISLLAGGVVFMLFYALLDRVERDYQRQRKLELQLSRANSAHQKAIQLEKLSAIGTMVGEIAHQLNNPLVGVVNLAQLAEREIDNPERSRELVQDIGRAGKECHGFVKRMLEFTKLSRFERSRTDMNELVRDTLSLFRQSAGEQVQVEIELPEPPPMLYIDRILVSHALFNLINNAAQASLDRKPIRIRLFPQEHEKRHLPGWCLTVQDHGPGVPDRILEKIYTPFFTTRAEGTGLGLTVVQHVAIVHEGEISAANTADGGAIFALWLPDTRDSPE